jgi:hypothetical protein
MSVNELPTNVQRRSGRGSATEDPRNKVGRDLRGGCRRGAWTAVVLVERELRNPVGSVAMTTALMGGVR